MSVVFVIPIIAIMVTLVAIVIAALSRHKKAGSRDLRLLGEIGRVDTTLDPEGTVLLSGELWRARSDNGATILYRSRVRVIGFQDHLVLVKVCD
jgi:membrane-bound ClpP family serine protease